MLMDPTMAAAAVIRLTWDIEGRDDGISKLTLIHELEGAPVTAALVAGEMAAEGAGGGWNEILSALKTLLESGTPIYG